MNALAILRQVVNDAVREHAFTPEHAPAVATWTETFLAVRDVSDAARNLTFDTFQAWA